MATATLTISNQIQCRGLDNKIIRTLKRDLTFDNPKYVDATKHGRYLGEEVPPYLKFFYKEYDDFIVPKGYLPILNSMLHKIGQEFKINILTIRGDKKPITFTGKLREYQESVVFDVLRYPLGVVEARTGSGKTVCALAVIAKRQESTLIVVHSKELLHQWKDKIKEFLGIDCGMIGDGKFDLKHITVGIINSVQRKKSKLRGHFSQMICDECHRSLAPTWIELITYMDCHYQLGLSATPFRRDDKMTKAIFYLIGPGIHRVDDKVLKDTGAILVPNIIKIGTFFQFEFRGDYPSMISSLVKDKRRNTIIYKGIRKELNTYGEQVLVVSERVGHCNKIAKLLKDGGVKVAVLSGSTKANDRKYIVRKMKQGDYEVLISTVSLIGEGFDAPDLSAMFLCSPIRFKGRVIQTIGRILRPGKNKTAPRLYDIRDTHVDQLRWSGVARDRTYRSQGWNV